MGGVGGGGHGQQVVCGGLSEADAGEMPTGKEV